MLKFKIKFLFCSVLLLCSGNELVPSPHFKSSFYYQQGLKFRIISLRTLDTEERTVKLR